MNIVSNMAVFSSQRLLFGLPVCDLDWAETFTFVGALADMPIGQTTISFLNAHNANVMRTDAEYRDSLSRHLVLPDGIGVDVASWAVHGRRFPANLNGTDFVPALMTYISTPKRVGLVGASADVLEKARLGFERHAPWHTFIAIHDGYFSESESASVTAKVAAAKVDILLVAMGTPKQEKWIDRHIRPEHARLVIGVGALFDFMGGVVPRAPELMRRLRMEWLHRVVQEPKRLSGRYFVGGPVFMAWAIGHAISERTIRATKALRPGYGRSRAREISINASTSDRRRA